MAVVLPRAAWRSAGSKRWTLILALLLTGTGAPAPASQDRLRATPVRAALPSAGAVLPIRWWCDYPLATVVIEGRGPFTFLLDTGASMCVVDLGLAEAFPERRVAQRIRVIGARGESVAAEGYVRLDDVRVGELVLEGVDALVLDLDAVAAALRTPIDGVLGFGTFVGLLLELDYPAREVRVEHGRLPEADGRAILELLPGLVPRIALEIGPGSQPVILDSGSGGGLDLDRYPREVELLSPPAAELGAFTAGGLGPLREVARLDIELLLGDEHVLRPVVCLTPGKARLGSELLRHFRWTFDGLGGRVKIERDAAGPVEVGPVRTSGLALGEREGKLVVWAVLPGSPAELAGVRTGDRVVALGGRPAAAFDTCDALRDWSEGAQELSARVERDGEVLELSWKVLVQVP